MIEKEIGKNILKKGCFASVIYVVMFIICFATITFTPSNLSIVKLIVGIFGYMWIPGTLLANLLGLFKSENLGFGLILGFLLQLINVFGVWILYSILGKVDFFSVITISTLILIVTFSLLLFKNFRFHKKESISWRLISFKNVDKYLLLSLILFLALGTYFQQYALQPNSDGASYLDLARNVVEHGIFRSNMLVLPTDWNNVLYSTGGITHIFGYFAFALFFVFGGVSLLSAKIGLMFASLLIIIVTFILTEQLLGKNTARLASIIVAISALFLTDVGLVGGPEITSALFTLLTIYLIFVSVKSDKKVLYFLAAVSAFVAWYAWYINFYALLGVLICSAVYFAPFKKESAKINLFLSLLLFASLIIDDRITSNFTLGKVGFPLPLLSMVMIPLVFLVSIWKNLKLPRFAVIISGTLAFLDFSYLSVLLTSSASRVFQTKLLTVGITQANVALTVSILSRAFRIENIIFYFNMLENGIYLYIGQAIILLVLISFVQVKKIKETIFLALFPLFFVLIWGLLVVTDGFQPRYAVCFSIFFDILAASAIIFIAKNATNSVYLTKIVELTIKKKKIRIDLRKLIGVLAVILLLGASVGVTFETYTNGKIVEQNWNLRQEFGWDNAISWIQSSTSSKDKIACIYGDYFSWYTDRPTVFLWQYPDLNTSTLVNLIRTLKVNYLIVDYPFSLRNPDLAGLYDSPSPFIGSTIAFMSQESPTKNVIIYNVTNIAYGELTTYQFEPDWKNLNNWSPLLWYGSGNITMDQDSVRIDSIPLERSPVATASTLSFSSLTNLSNYTTLQFLIKVPNSTGINLEIYSGISGQDYYVFAIKNSVFDEWTPISIQMVNYSSIYGNPNLQNASKLNFIVTGVPVGETATFWIKDLQFSGQYYELGNLGK